MHYKRWWRNGDPVRTLNDQAIQHLLRTYQDPDAHEGWPFARSVDGYSRVHYEGRDTYGHEVSCSLTHGPRPFGLVVRHSCLNRHCYWADHLSWGTQSQNSKEDRRRDGTDNRGEQHPLHKVSWEEAREIRRIYSLGGTTQRELGVLYKISRENVGYIVRNRTWID
jgi:HNH endonuclease